MQFLHLIYKTIIQHNIYSFINICIKTFSFIVQYKITEIIRGFFLSLFFVVFRNFCTCFLIKFQSTNHSFYIIGVNAIR